MANFALSFSALLSLIPAALAPYRRDGGRDTVFWSVTLVALAGPVIWSIANQYGAWRTGFAAALWVTVAATMVVYVVLAAATRHAWRLAPLLFPYLLLLGLLATVWGSAPGRPLVGIAPAAWLNLHIAVSVATYALVTLAAIAALAVALRERALKAKRPGRFSNLLPSVADAEMLQVRLLAAGEAVLGFGLLSGMGTQYFTSGTLMEFGHKPLLALAAFVVIGLLLLAQMRTGMGARMAARLVLVAYLLLTLAYPGVKFVTDVLVG